ncbi:MAG TPA: TonB-dependent siderophore receptor [Pyrinomonadaceae bacterium]|nr:TonB-dependent siderophore receptor [Pyrinomonadaceae bacterium]
MFVPFRLIICLFTVDVLFALTTLGFRQSPSIDALTGVVIDQNGASVAGAEAVATNADGKISKSVISDSDGKFRLELEPGNYTLTVRARGFGSLSRQIKVGATANSPIELKLSIEAATATVNVTDSGVYQLGTTSSATKTFTALSDVPQSISVATKQQISDQKMTSIGDVVRYLPGISAHQGENNRDQIIIRGQSTSADFFVNGVRDDVQYYRDLYNLDRVEILRGPNALVFGRGGGGGVINRVTKEADFTTAYEISLQGGAFGDRRATFDLNQPLGKKFAVRGNGVAEYAESFRRNVNMRRAGFSPTLAFNPDARTHITASYEFFRDHRVADRGMTSFRGRPVDLPISTYYGNPKDSYVRSNTNLFSVSIDRQFGNLIARNRTMYGDYDRGYQNYVPGAVNSVGTLVTLTVYNNAMRRRNIFNQTDFIYDLKTGGLKHTMLGGFEFGSQRSKNFRNTGFFDNTATSIQVPFDNPLTTTAVTFRQSATDADNHINVRLGAAYIQDQIAVNRYLQVIAGARFDYFDLRFHNNRNDTDLRRIDRLVSPRLGIIVKPITELRLYGSYSVSYLPSSGDQFSSLTTISEQVKPEKFTNYEVGVKWDVKPNFSLAYAVYRLDRTNTRSVDPNDPTRIIQTGSQRTNGFEIGFAGSPARRWSLTGGYAYQNAFITNATASAAAGKQVAQVPHHSLSVWNKYQVTRRFAVGLGIIRRTDIFAGVDNTVVLPGYTRADAAVYYSFNERWRLQANVENFLNSRYYLNADSNTNISPGSPRAAKVSLIARF